MHSIRVVIMLLALHGPALANSWFLGMGSPDPADWTEHMAAVWLCEEGTGTTTDASQCEGGSDCDMDQVAGSGIGWLSDTTNPSPDVDPVQGTYACHIASNGDGAYTNGLPGAATDNLGASIDVTMGGWVYQDVTSSNGGPRCRDNFSTGSSGTGFGIQQSGSSSRWQAVAVGNSNYTASGLASSLDKWRFEVNVISDADAANRKAFAWSNGGYRAKTGSIAGYGIEGSGGGCVIGSVANTDRWDRGVIGYYDEVWIYGGQLHGQSICRIARCGLDGSECSCDPADPTQYAASTGRAHPSAESWGCTLDGDLWPCNAVRPRTALECEGGSPDSEDICKTTADCDGAETCEKQDPS